MSTSEPVHDLYTADELASFTESGGYLGWRTGIESNGSWTFFVAGD